MPNKYFGNYQVSFTFHKIVKHKYIGNFQVPLDCDEQVQLALSGLLHVHTFTISFSMAMQCTSITYVLTTLMPVIIQESCFLCPHRVSFLIIFSILFLLSFQPSQILTLSGVMNDIYDSKRNIGVCCFLFKAFKFSAGPRFFRFFLSSYWFCIYSFFHFFL